MEPYIRQGKLLITNKKVRLMMERTLDFTAGDMIGVSKKWPSKMICDLCGDVLDLVSVEEAYSCRNKSCKCHVVLDNEEVPVEDEEPTDAQLEQYAELLEGYKSHINCR